VTKTKMRLPVLPHIQLLTSSDNWTNPLFLCCRCRKTGPVYYTDARCVQPGLACKEGWGHSTCLEKETCSCDCICWLPVPATGPRYAQIYPNLGYFGYYRYNTIYLWSWLRIRVQFCETDCDCKKEQEKCFHSIQTHGNDKCSC
jgi:hypothetical protein